MCIWTFCRLLRAMVLYNDIQLNDTLNEIYKFHKVKDLKGLKITTNKDIYFYIEIIKDKIKKILRT